MDIKQYVLQKTVTVNSVSEDKSIYGVVEDVNDLFIALRHEVSSHKTIIPWSTVQSVEIQEQD